MTQLGTEEKWENLVRLAERGDAAELTELLDTMPASEIALSMSRLSDDEQQVVLTSLPPETTAGIIGQLPEVQAAELIENLEAPAAAAILQEMPSDEQADLIGDLPKSDAQAILAQLDPAQAAGVRELCEYDDEVAGGLMVREYLEYAQHITVADVIDDMREHAERYRDYDVQYAYVADDQDRLTGVLRLRDLLLAGRSSQLTELMIRDPLSVPDTMPLEDLADLFDRHSYLGVPVTDAGSHLLGVVQRSAVERAWGEHQESDFLKTRGIVSGEEIRSMPVLRRARGRLSWLAVNILLNIVAASVIAAYQETLASVIALAVFLPIISDMSGCSGNQAVAVSMRELALGLVRPSDTWWVWLRELAVGLINGCVLGLMIAVAALLWKGNPYLGLIVGMALFANTLIAVSIGGLVPLLLKRWKMDPAIASGPILTTVTDMCGFFILLALATFWLDYLN